MNLVRENHLVHGALRGVRQIFTNRMTAFYFAFLVFVICLGIFGPHVAPYEHDETIYRGGELQRAEPPSLHHPLGTNLHAQDVLSRMLIGARPTVIAALLGGTTIITIGSVIGITAGYMGGWVDDVLMRFTDLVYGVPLLPFAIVLVGLVGMGFYATILVIGGILWRGSARVLRSQVLQIKERPYILAAKSTGASSLRIVVKHIVPNVATMGLLFFALGIGYTIIIFAGLAFLGVTDPFVPSWGVMLRNAFRSGQMGELWWWSLPPGLMIGFTVLATFMFGRGYEEISGADEDAFVEGAQ